MKAILHRVKQLEPVEGCCLMKGKDIELSLFAPKDKPYFMVAKQAFNFLAVKSAKLEKHYDEMHFHIGQKRLSAFIVGAHVIISLSDKAIATSEISESIKAFCSNDVNSLREIA